MTRFFKNRLLKVGAVCAGLGIDALCDLMRPAALDGNQVLDFYWTDPIDAMIRSVGKLQYKDKLYTTFKPGMSIAELRKLHEKGSILLRAMSNSVQ